MRTHIKWLMMVVLFALVANGCGYNTLQMEEQVFRPGRTSNQPCSGGPT